MLGPAEPGFQDLGNVGHEALAAHVLSRVLADQAGEKCEAVPGIGDVRQRFVSVFGKQNAELGARTAFVGKRLERIAAILRLLDRHAAAKQRQRKTC
jgi:hypothetical protein